MLRKISTWFNETANEEPIYKWCDHDGCQKEGIYKAPKRADQNPNHKDPSYWYFLCKDHVRTYNASWNFYQNMTEAQAQHSYYQDRHGNVPTWPMGTHPYQHIYTNQAHYHDPFNLFEQQREYREPVLNAEQTQALKILQLPYPFSTHQLQTAYRNLVKENHPDVQKTIHAEENIRQINQAYQVLKKHAQW